MKTILNCNRCLFILGGFLMPLVSVHGTNDEPVIQEPYVINDPGLTISYNLQHMTTSWEAAKIIARLNPEGLIEEWIPLYLPDYRLLATIDRGMADLEFSPMYVDGEATGVDLRLDIPFNGSMGFEVINQTIADHIASMQALMGVNPYEMKESKHSDLDEAIEILDEGSQVLAVDDEGNILEGVVDVEFYINHEGFPRLIRIRQADQLVMAAAARETVKTLRFTPPKVGGLPTVVKVRMPVILRDK